MKETERVSLGGYAFTLDQDATALMAEYLDELGRHYATREGGDEVLEGIEERMAELLHEQCGRDGVASKAVVEKIIGILGRPEQIEAEEDPAPAEGSSIRPDREPAKRKLYRDMSNKVVAGVCSGLSTYFNIDVALFRILFVAGTIAMSVPDWHGHFTFHLLFPLVYLILWIAMPPARTVRQRWEQRGEDGTINSLQQNIESGAREIGEAARTVGQSPVWGQLGKVIEKLVGVVLLLIGFAGLFGGGVFTFGSGFLQAHPETYTGLFGLGQLYSEGLSELYSEAPAIASALNLPWVRGLMLLVVFLPFLGVTYGALQLLFGFKSPSWHPGLVIFVLWLLCIIAAGILITTGALSASWTTL
ncbi:MAG: PspC domain-containing protein [Bacteroidales bacterium]|nr:PspC domain-containing protein [Bacteroidales bacterium]